MSRAKIVLADDVELFLMLEKTVFNREEFELITGRDGRAILKIIREAEPDLVFMNLYMPEMNGDECCQLVKQDDAIRHIPVIMVIQGGREEDLDKCRLAGCDDILIKPINRNDFMATTRKYLQVMVRADQRIKARIPIHYSVMSGDFLNDYCIDLNTGGMFLQTKHPFMVDTTLSLEFKLPTNGSTIRCKARGAWVNDPAQRKKPNLPPGMGVQFLDISLSDMNAIQDYIKSENAEIYCRRDSNT
jgi:uncharacterized protein (TIGR02266 family)